MRAPSKDHRIAQPAASQCVSVAVSSSPAVEGAPLPSPTQNAEACPGSVVQSLRRQANQQDSLAGIVRWVIGSTTAEPRALRLHEPESGTGGLEAEHADRLGSLLLAVRRQLEREHSIGEDCTLGIEQRQTVQPGAL